MALPPPYLCTHSLVGLSKKRQCQSSKLFFAWSTWTNARLHFSPRFNLRCNKEPESEYVRQEVGAQWPEIFLMLKSHMCVITKYFSKLFNRNLVFRKSILPKSANFCSSTIFCTVTKLLRYYQYNHVHLQVNSKLLFTSLNTIAYIRSYFVKK